MAHPLIGLLVGVLTAVPSVAGRDVLGPALIVPVRVAVRPVTEEPVLIDWKILNGLNLDTGKAPASLKALDGKRVKIAAFIVPLEDDLQEADEFLLVPYFGACIHTPPPPPNQMVYVKMPAGKTVRIGWWDPVMFEGVLHLKEVDSPYGSVSYEMQGVARTPYAPKKP